MQKLLNTGFGKIIHTEINHNRLNFRVELNPQHEIYTGHFPHRPITPGVCSLQMIRELLETHFQQKLQLRKADNIKFSGMIDPQQMKEVSFIITILSEPISDNIIVKASIEASEHIFCKFSGEYFRV